MIQAREEDEADRWLREHDPYYEYKGRDKKSMLSHPYDTPKQEIRKNQQEIPLSNLSMSQMYEIGGEITDASFRGMDFEL